VAEYQTRLPDRTLCNAKLAEFYDREAGNEPGVRIETMFSGRFNKVLSGRCPPDRCAVRHLRVGQKDAQQPVDFVRMCSRFEGALLPVPRGATEAGRLNLDSGRSSSRAV